MDQQALEVMSGVLGAVFTPAGMFVAALVAGVLGGAIISLILALIMKKPPPITD
jgi:hypothetical protein